ncbi:hypothetical protein D3C71_1063610 [compost metagenome]
MLSAREYVAFADFRFDFLWRGIRFLRTLDFDGQQILRGPVFVRAQLEGETPVGVGGFRFVDLDVLVATVHVPEGGLQGFHRGVGEADVDLVTAVLQVQVFAVDHQFVFARLQGGAPGHLCILAFATVVQQRHHLAVDGFLVEAIQRREFPDENFRRVLLELVAAQVLQHRTFQAAAGERHVENVGADGLFEETGEVVVLATVGGTHEGDLRVAGIAEQIAIARFALRLGGELIHVLDRVAGATELTGHVVQCSGLAHATRLFGLEFALGNVGEFRQLLDLLGDDFRRALGTVRRPVLVATEVEIVGGQGVGQLFVGQRRQVRNHVAHLRETAKHGLVVPECLVEIEAGFLGRVQLVAVHQATRWLVNNNQFHAFALECIVQLLHAFVAGRGGVEFGAQVFLRTEQPVALSLHQRGEILLITRGVILRVVGGGAQAAARFGAELRCLNFIGTRAGTGRENAGGQGRQAE